MAIDRSILKLVRTNVEYVKWQHLFFMKNMTSYEQNVFKLVKKKMSKFTTKDGKVEVDDSTLNEINSLDKAILNVIKKGRAGDSDDTYLKDVKKYLKSFDQVQKHQEKIQHEVNGLPYESEKVAHQMSKDDDFTTNLSDMTKGGDLIPKDFYSRPELYANFNAKDKRIANSYKESWDVIKKMEGDPDGEVTIYRGIPKDGIDKIHQGEWISLSKSYADLESKDGKVIQQKVKASEVIWDGNDMNEFSFYPESVEQNKTMEELVEPFKKQMIEDTLQGLTGSGVNDAFVVPIREQLFKNAVAGVTIDEMEKSIKTFIEGNDQDVGKFSAYVGQISRDSLNQYDGMINQQMAKDYNLDAYQYVGSLKGTSRPQCKRWVAMGVLLKEDLSKLLNSSPMQGLIAGTNENNFAVFRGGYNCRHTAIPFRMTTRERKRYDSKQYQSEIAKKVERESKQEEAPASKVMDLTYDRKIESGSKNNPVFNSKGVQIYGWTKPKGLKDNPELDVLPDQYWEMFDDMPTRTLYGKTTTMMPKLETGDKNIKGNSAFYQPKEDKVYINLVSNHTPIAQKQVMIHEFAHAQERRWADLQWQKWGYYNKKTGKRDDSDIGKMTSGEEIEFYKRNKLKSGGFKLKYFTPKYEENFQESRKLFKEQEKSDKKIWDAYWKEKKQDGKRYFELETNKYGHITLGKSGIPDFAKGHHKKYKGLKLDYNFGTLTTKYWSKVNEYEAKYKGIYSREDISEFLGAYSDTMMALSYEKYGGGHTKAYMKANGGAGRRFEFYVHSAENFWMGNPIFRDENPDLYKLMTEQYKKINSL